MLANIALALGLEYTASEEEIIAKANSLQREISTLRVTQAAGRLPYSRKELQMSEYVPFGDEWKAEVMRLKKSEIVDMLAKALREQAIRPTPRAADGCKAEQHFVLSGSNKCMACGKSVNRRR